MDRVQRYFLTEGDEPEREVSLAQYLNAEKRAGFRGPGHHEDPPRPACASFGSTKRGESLRGRTEPLR